MRDREWIIEKKKKENWERESEEVSTPLWKAREFTLEEEEEEEEEMLF